MSLNVGIVTVGDVGDTDAAGDRSGVNWTEYALTINQELRRKRFFEDILPEEFIPVRDEIVFYLRRGGWDVELTPIDDQYFLTVRYKKPAPQVVRPLKTPAAAVAPVPTVVVVENNQGQGGGANTGDAHSPPQDDQTEPALAHTCQDSDLPCAACVQGRACLGSLEVTPGSDGPSAASTNAAATGVASNGGTSPQAAPATVAVVPVNRLEPHPDAIVLDEQDGESNGEELPITLQPNPQPAARETRRGEYAIAGGVTMLVIIAAGLVFALVVRYL
jgi:hypothetical protein